MACKKKRRLVPKRSLPSSYVPTGKQCPGHPPPRQIPGIGPALEDLDPFALLDEDELSSPSGFDTYLMPAATLTPRDSDCGGAARRGAVGPAVAAARAPGFKTTALRHAGVHAVRHRAGRLASEVLT
jgi:hypothetical protein